MQRSLPTLPETIASVQELEDLLSEPPTQLIERLAGVPGDILILGVGGKMGPSLACMARRASDAAGVRRRVIGVARFSEPDLQARLEHAGVETIGCDLLDTAQLAALPDAANVIFMAGRKFGSTGHEAVTWAMNSYLPALVCRRFCESRIVAFSTGNVYGLTPVTAGGSVETDAPNPVGEYAMSCLGRERLFEYFGQSADVAVTLLRLNYACELRYGVVVDLAQRIYAGEPIDLTMGYFNVIWQADANAAALTALGLCERPPRVVNVAGPEVLSVRQTSEQLAAWMDRTAHFVGTEADQALLSNGRLGHRLFGPPRISAERLIHWIAEWIQRGGPTLGKPTHFEIMDGRF
jgi:dTDP-4-dehydrorhamnose reductase